MSLYNMFFIFVNTFLAIFFVLGEDGFGFTFEEKCVILFYMG